MEDKWNRFLVDLKHFSNQEIKKEIAHYVNGTWSSGWSPRAKSAILDEYVIRFGMLPRKRR